MKNASGTKHPLDALAVPLGPRGGKKRAILPGKKAMWWFLASEELKSAVETLEKLDTGEDSSDVIVERESYGLRLLLSRKAFAKLRRHLPPAQYPEGMSLWTYQRKFEYVITLWVDEGVDQILSFTAALGK